MKDKDRRKSTRGNGCITVGHSINGCASLQSQVHECHSGYLWDLLILIKLHKKRAVETKLLKKRNTDECK